MRSDINNCNESEATKLVRLFNMDEFYENNSNATIKETVLRFVKEYNKVDELVDLLTQ